MQPGHGDNHSSSILSSTCSSASSSSSPSPPPPPTSSSSSSSSLSSDTEVKNNTSYISVSAYDFVAYTRRNSGSYLKTSH